jgi:hypothetical protein
VVKDDLMTLELLARTNPRIVHISGPLVRLRRRERCLRAGLRPESTGAIVLTFDNDRSGRAIEVSLDGTQAYP